MKDITSEEIDILRGIAALGVIAGHSLYVDWKVINGAFWVWIFFVVSGFLQGYFFFSGRYTLDRKGICRYYFNRLIRIVPLLWLILLIGWATKYSVDHSIDFVQMFREFFCLTNDYQSVGAVWTIACEMSFYLAVPFLIFAFKKKQSVFLLMIVVLIFFIYLPFRFDNSLQPRTALGNIHLFLTGMFAAYFYSKNFPLNSFLKFLVLFALLGWVSYLSETPSFWSKGMLFASIITIITLMFAGRRTFIHTLLAPVRFVGKYCYGVYMYAVLLYSIFYSLCNIQPGYLMLALQLLAIPLAYISYHAFEKHFLKFRLSEPSNSKTDNL
jgi:peptidoglycan/LPS O-acetylase OafA/YrhL